MTHAAAGFCRCPATCERELAALLKARYEQNRCVVAEFGKNPWERSTRQIGIATARILAGVTRVARPSTLYRRQKHQFSYSSHKIVLPSLRSASSDLILPAPCKAYQVRSSDTCTHHQQSPSCRRSAVPLRSLFPIGRRRRS